MAVLTKGKTTRNLILAEARNTFNQFGIQITLAELAEKTSISMSKINNHFPTKDHLFVGLSEQYQQEHQNLKSSFKWDKEITLKNIHQFVGIMMDLQYTYRCLLLYVCAIGPNQKTMLTRVTESWNFDQKGFKDLIVALTHSGLLVPEIVKKPKYETFRFQFINLFTTWLVSFTIYDINLSYEKMKPVYHKGIMMCFYPFLTDKGDIEFKRLNNLK
jgi:AcrR family transcriptional regulator